MQVDFVSKLDTEEERVFLMLMRVFRLVEPLQVLSTRAVQTELHDMDRWFVLLCLKSIMAFHISQFSFYQPFLLTFVCRFDLGISH